MLVNTKTLVENTATTFAIIGIGDQGYFGGLLAATVFASDGGDVQVQQSDVLLAATRYDNYEVATPIQRDVKCGSNGNLTLVEYTAVVSADGQQLLLKCKASRPLTQTTLKLNWQFVAIHGSTDMIVTSV